MHIDQKRHTHIWKCHRLTLSPCPPSREFFLSCHSSRRCSLMSNPINCGKAIWRVVIPTSSSNTGCKLSAVNAFNPGYRGLVYKGRVRIIDMVNCQLYVHFLVRVKLVRFKSNDFTMIFGPGGDVLEYVSSFLKRETCKRTKTILHGVVWYLLIHVCCNLICFHVSQGRLQH